MNYDLINKTLHRPVLWATVIFVVMILCSLAEYMGIDEAIWSYMGRMWVAGHPVYSETVDNKPPGILLVYAISNCFFGVGMWFPRLLGCLAMTAATVGVYDIARRFAGRTAGVVAMVLMGLATSWSVIDSPFTAHTEGFMVFFAVMSFWTLIAAGGWSSTARYRWGVVLSGVLMGLAIGFKQVAIFTAGAWLFMYVSLRGRGRLERANSRADILCYAAGCVIGMALLIGPVLMSGVGFGEYFYGTWIIPLQNGTGSGSLAIRASRFMEIWQQSQMVLFYPLVALFLLRKRHIVGGNVPWGGLLAWAMLDFLAAGSSGYYYGHQIRQTLPTLALMGAIGVSGLLEWVSAKKMVQVMAVLVALWMPYGSLLKGVSPHPADTKRELGLWIKDNTEPGDRVLTMGWSAFQVLAWCDRPAVSRHFNFLLMNIPGAREELARDIARRPPRILVIPTHWRGGNGECPDWLAAMLDSYRLLKVENECDVLERIVR